MALDTQVIEFAKTSGWRRKCGDLLRRLADAIDTGGVSLRAHRTRKVSGARRLEEFDPRIDARVMDVPFAPERKGVFLSGPSPSLDDFAWLHPRDGVKLSFPKRPPNSSPQDDESS